MNEQHPTEPWQIELFYDGECPLCSREINWLRRRDRRGAVKFTDIADPRSTLPATGRPYDELMARIHARLADGTWIEGMDVFRRIYGAVGLGWMMAPTRWPILSRLADAAYAWFARNRIQLARRCDTVLGTAPRRDWI